MNKSTLYTRTGDAGQTSLIGGTRAPKDSLRLEAYGTIDELNSHIGLLINLAAQTDLPDEYRLLLTIQNKLFNIGAALANPALGPDSAVAGLGEPDLQAVEQAIDRLDADVPPVFRFTLPGGCLAACQAHICRTVCRRAERRVVSLDTAHPVPTVILRYLNRLSDYLYIFARFNNIATQTDEIFWDKDC